MTKQNNQAGERTQAEHKAHHTMDCLSKGDSITCPVCGPITYEVLTARLASVTSAFLVLKHDSSITGGAKKLIEKECELLSTGESGAPMIRELRSLRSKLEHYELLDNKIADALESAEAQRNELLVACRECESVLRANFATPMSIEGRRAMCAVNQARTAIANAQGA